MSKKFEIMDQPPKMENKKKFEITKEPRSKFKIEGVTRPVVLPDTDREVSVAFQRNANDCGPCLVLNINNVLSNATELRDISSVRRKNNEIKGQNMDDNYWFMAFDVEQLLANANLDVDTSFVQRPEDLQYIRNIIMDLIRQNKEFVVYTSSGRHYKAVYYQDSNNIFLIDSLDPNEQVMRKNPQYIDSFLQGATNTGRQEVVGVVKRKENSNEQ